MSERLYGPRPEVRIVDTVNIDEWTERFNADFAAHPEKDRDSNEATLKASHDAVVSVEQWFEQTRDYEASSYFNLEDRLGSEGWMQRVEGKVYHTASVYMPRSVGGRKEPVLALYEASIIRSDGTREPIADGRTVMVRLSDIERAEIEIAPIQTEVELSST